MGLKEILAAKKAAAKAATEDGKVERIATELANKKQEEKPITESNKKMTMLDALGITDSGETVMEPTASPVKETFSQKMARLKAKREAQNTTVTTVDEDGTPDEPETPTAPPVIELTEEQKERLKDAESEEEAQAYTDIAIKINALRYSAAGQDLSKAMDNLTAALHKNPSASMLLLDPDIGQMTIAIRKLVGDELEAAKAPKGKKSKAAKQIELTPERLDQQFAVPDDM